MSEILDENLSPNEESRVIFPREHKYLTFLKKVFRHEFRKNWFRRITVPIMQDGVFRKSAEEGIMKAYLENDIASEIQPVYYYYMDQFMKNWIQEQRIGWEILWENDPILDAIAIYLHFSVFNKIGLEWTFKIRVNSVWIEKEKIKYNEELISFYENKKHLLSDSSLELLEKNPMMLLASKDEDEKILASQAPAMVPKFLKKDSKAHWTKFIEYLDILKIPYEIDHTLLFDKEHSTNTVWSIDTEGGINLAQGSRYNTLAKNLWNPKDVSASGFFTNTYAIMDMLIAKNIKIRNKDKIDLFIVQLWDDAKKVVLPLSLKARDAGINTVVSLWTPSMREQMLKATRSWAKYMVMVWLMEAKNGIFQIRDQEAWTQEEVKKEDLIDYIIEKIGKDSLDFYEPSRDLLKE